MNPRKTKAWRRGLIVLSVSSLAIVAPCWSAPASSEPDGRDKLIESLNSRLSILEKKLEDQVVARDQENKSLKLNGAIRFNYSFDDFNDSQKTKKGDIGFDLFRLGVDGAYKDLVYSAQYRWTGHAHYVHHAYIGYNFSDETGAQLGVTRVPFGVLPYATHNFWQGIPYYLGLDDDYDMGVKLIRRNGPWDLQLAFFKNEEWANPSKLDRYSYDVVKALGQSNEETNQFNARLAYTLDRGEKGNTEIGLSGEWGQLYNSDTDDNGDRWAAAAHLNSNHGPFNLRLEVIEYAYNPENSPGIDDRTVVMGAFSDAFLVAAKGRVYSAGLSYDVPVNWGPISKLTFYDDYSRLVKDEKDFSDSEINTLGCMVTAGPIFTFIDLISGKNAMYLGGPRDAFGSGDRSGGWGTKLNINIGYYF